ncbi:MAG: HD domain-containing protein, partial [Paracoccaceae bacterium]
MTERDDGEQVYLAALAGLLHDIGKFAQRAGWGSGRHTEVGGEVVRQYVPEPWREGLYPVMGHHDCELLDRSTRVVALADRLSAGERIDEACAQPQHLQSIFCGLRTANGEASPPRAYWPLSPLRLDEMALFPGDAPPEAATVAAYGDLWTGFERELAALRDAHADGEDLPVYLETL